MSWTELQALVTEAREATEHWKEQYQRVADERAAHKGAAEAQRKTADERLARMIHSGALRQVLPHKLGLTTRRLVPAGDRLTRFLDASASYREARGKAQDAPGAPARIDGLPWRIPVGAAPPVSPLHTIAQTRDVGIGGLSVEIGAGTGAASIARVALGDSMGAYCTEPDPAAYACLVANARACGLDAVVLPDCVRVGTGESGDRTLDQWTADVGVDTDLLGCVQINGPIALPMLDGAAGLLARRHIVWQLEVVGESLDADQLRTLVTRLTASFTHFIVISTPPPGPRIRPVQDLEAVIAGDDAVAVVLYSEAQSQAR